MEAGRAELQVCPGGRRALVPHGRGSFGRGLMVRNGRLLPLHRRGKLLSGPGLIGGRRRIRRQSGRWRRWLQGGLQGTQQPGRDLLR